MDLATPLIWKTRDNIYLKSEVQLKKTTFEEHVINDRNRKELIGEELTLKSVVEYPDYIVRDKTIEGRIEYGGIRTLESIAKAHWVSVCVDTSTTPADVCTTMTCRKIPSNITKEYIIYDSTKPNTQKL